MKGLGELIQKSGHLVSTAASVVVRVDISCSKGGGGGSSGGGGIWPLESHCSSGSNTGERQGGRLKLLRLQLVGAALSTVGHGASIFVQNKGLLVRRTRQYCSLDPPLAQHRATCLAKTLCHNH